ncbi:hypothetical protein BKA82DRAFT_160200 [Pisolithus tinctorius]|nr:hypothetical protein BKA82DRAFT_160200 [Pisolithus tinctorius]
MDSSSLSKPGSCVKDNLPWHPYHETRTGQQFPTALSSLSQEILHDNNFHTCRSMILMNGDRCIPGQWVLIHQQNGQQPLVAQMTSSPDAIFLQSGKIQGSTRPYQMPLVQYDDTNILLPIEGTSNTSPSIVHKGNPNDFMLNTAKMRDAKHILPLVCEPLTPLNTDHAIMEGCVHEIDNKKSTQYPNNIPQPWVSSSGHSIRLIK